MTRATEQRKKIQQESIYTNQYDAAEMSQNPIKIKSNNKKQNNNKKHQTQTNSKANTYHGAVNHTKRSGAYDVFGNEIDSLSDTPRTAILLSTLVQQSTVKLFKVKNITHNCYMG